MKHATRKIKNMDEMLCTTKCNWYLNGNLRKDDENVNNLVT